MRQSHLRSCLILESDNCTSERLSLLIRQRHPRARVSIAANPNEAIGLAAENTPDIILVNLRLAEPTNFQVMKDLQEICLYAILIALVDPGDTHLLIEANANNIDRFVAKPIQDAIAIRTIENCVGLIPSSHPAEAETGALRSRTLDLEAANSELRQANELLSAFNYTASHNLRRPLSNINVASQVILSLWAESLTPNVRDSVANILREVRVLDNRILALLKFAQTAHRGIAKEDVDLTCIANEITTSVSSNTRRKDFEFRIENGLTVNCDPDLIRDVMENLINNAWKYCSKNRSTIIEVGAKKIGGQTVFFVRDNGAGFDMSQYDKIFKPFCRLHDSTEFEGNGIGLATVEKIIKRHDGKIWAESEKGKGATFYFTVGPRPSLTVRTNKTYHASKSRRVSLNA